MTAPILWPSILQPVDVAFDLVPRSLAAPSSVTGLGQVVASDAGAWKATFGSVVVRNRAQILAHRALAAQLEGRLNPVIVPLCRAWQPELEGVDSDEVLGGVPHSDEAPFSDGSLYVGSVNKITITGSAPARSTTINVFIEYGGTIEPGQHFSIGDRLYRVRKVTYTTANTAAITFLPPLRASATDGAAINFDSPVCRMRLLDDAGLDLMLALHRYSSPTIEFVEDI